MYFIEIVTGVYLDIELKEFHFGGNDISCKCLFGHTV